MKRVMLIKRTLAAVCLARPIHQQYKPGVSEPANRSKGAESLRTDDPVDPSL